MVSERHNLLLKVVNQTLSFAEMKAAADNIKQMDRLHEAFLALTSCTSWKEALAEYGQWLHEDTLRPFCSLFTSRTSQTPTTFLQFVQSIMQAKKQKTKIGEWKQFKTPTITASYQVIQCDIINNLFSISHLASNFNLAIADIPYGLSQPGSEWDTDDWKAPVSQLTSVSFILI